MPVKRAAGTFMEIVAHDAPASNPLYRDGRSRIVKLITRGGQHVGTVHEIVMPDGAVPHSHPKDYTLRDCSRVRLPAAPGDG
ncbi:MAG: hypothetical protein IT304_01915 [Dehalococcoidia bacterium]|nr:hypothetical protein [Dehalococcoidia bacterium]